MTRLIIIGAGGYGRTIADLANQSGQYNEIKFLDDNASGKYVVGNIALFQLLIDENTVFYPAIGNNTFRCELINRVKSAGGIIISFIHPTAYVSPTAAIGAGVAVLPNSSVGTNVVIGDGCIVNMGAIVDHDTVLEEGVHVAPGAVVKGENRIERYRKIESGSVIEKECKLNY